MFHGWTRIYWTLLVFILLSILLKPEFVQSVNHCLRKDAQTFALSCQSIEVDHESE